MPFLAGCLWQLVIHNQESWTIERCGLHQVNGQERPHCKCDQDLEGISHCSSLLDAVVDWVHQTRHQSRFGRLSGSRLIANRLVNFLSMDRCTLGGLDADLHSLTANPDDFKGNIISDNDSFARFSRKYQHASQLQKHVS